MKLRIVYFRLLNPYKLDNNTKQKLEKYICDSKEAWDIIMEEHRNELEYYKIFTEAGAATDRDFATLIADMDNVSAEIKAFMLRFKEDNSVKEDAFSAFELDW
jgi:argininosuccinate lyase